MSLEKVQPGDKIKADAWNALTEAARKTQTLKAGSGVGVKNFVNGQYIDVTPNERILGVIVCCGDCEQNEGCTNEEVQQARNTDKKCEPQNGDDECCQPREVDGCFLEQFDDNRYWVVFGKVDPATYCSPVSVSMRDDCSDVKWKKVVATNLAENNCGSHLLPPGTVVELTEWYTDQTPPQKVYTFTRTPMPGQDYVDECTDRTCGCPESSSSVSSSSQSSHSQSGCCDCITFVVTGGLHIDFYKTEEGTYQGQGYTLTWDGGKWFLGGGAGAIAAHAKGDRGCPPMQPSDYTLDGEGEIEDIYCCRSESSSSQSSHSHSKSGSQSLSTSLPSGSSSNSQSNSNSLSHSQPSTPSNPPLSGSGSQSGSGQSHPDHTPSDSGSQKSTAIVPASFSPTGYTALYISEAPEVRFDDVITAKVKQKNTVVPIDPKYLEVCEADTIQVYGFASDEPITLGAKVKGSNVELKFAAQAEDMLEIVIRLTGIRKGFKGVRFGDRTKEQFERNEKFINSAY